MSLPQHEPNGQRGDGFTKREVEVLELAAQGMTNAEIAGRLELSVHAIKFHLASIYRKLGVGNRTEAAVSYALAARMRETAESERPISLPGI